MIADTLVQTYKVSFDENNQEFALSGSMRPEHGVEMEACTQLLERSIASIRGTFYINVKRLVRLNNVAFHALASALLKAADERPDVRISIVTSSVIGWSTKKFGTLSAKNPRTVVSI